MGAQKVKKDFAEIEREAELADQTRSRMEEERKEAARKTAEDEEKALASARLAYQDLSLQQKKQEEKLRKMDPKKAEQVERLGMGASSGRGVFSHSAITEMSTIEQEEPRGSMGGRSLVGGSSRRRDYDEDRDDFGGFGREDKYERDSYDFGGRKDYSSTNDRSDDWEKEFEVGHLVFCMKVLFVNVGFKLGAKVY